MNRGAEKYCRRVNSPFGAACAFTLIELLIVVVVLGIAGALVIPSMSSTGVLRVQSAVRTLVADLVFAQSDALAYQSRRVVWFGKVAVLDQGSGTWSYEDGNGYVVAQVNGPVLDLVTDALPDPEDPARPFSRDFDLGRYGAATIGDIDFNNGSMLIFDELGGTVAELDGDNPGVGGRVQIAGSGSLFRIDVAPYTGRVTVTRLEDENNG